MPIFGSAQKRETPCYGCSCLFCDKYFATSLKIHSNPLSCLHKGND